MNKLPLTVTVSRMFVFLQRFFFPPILIRNQNTLYTSVMRSPPVRRSLWSSSTIDWHLAPHTRGFYITHKEAPQSVGLLWTSGQLVAETSAWQHTTLTTDKHPCPCGIRTQNLSRRAADELRLRPSGHWDRPYSDCRANSLEYPIKWWISQ
jgi:hypothetical protein